LGTGGDRIVVDMYFAYVIKSLKDGSLYKRHCQEIEVRLKQHNRGETLSIKNKIPFVLIYFEKFETRIEAIKREKYFKTAAGRRF
jgi:putative endonuclease